MAPPSRTELVAILVIGGAVGLAPYVWYSHVWPGQTNLLSGSGMAWMAFFAVVPFVGLSIARRAKLLGRTSEGVAVVAAGTVVVLLQVATLDPNDQSSTQAIGIVLMPIYGLIAVAIVAALDGISRAAARRFR